MNASSPTPAAAGEPKASPGKALVTGGASGMGLAIVERLARDGYAVVMADRNGELAARGRQLRAQGLDVDHRVVDLADEAATRALARELAPLAALVNNAGLFDERKFFDVSSDDYRRMYEVNLLAVATLTQEAARDMAPGGKIVNIASRAYLGAKNHPSLRGLQGRAGGLYPRLGHGTGAARHSGQCDRARPDRHAAAAQPVARAAGRATGAAAHGPCRATARHRQCRVLPGRAAHGLHHRPGHFRGRRQIAGRIGSMSSMEGIKWDLEVDALVVGSGAGGMAAALTAREEGLDVLLVEKTDRIGGSTAISGGALWIPLNAQSEGAGHPDTFEQVWTYLQQTVGAASSDAMKRAYLEAGPRMMDLVERGHLQVAARTASPDYYPDCPGAAMGGRSLDPVEFDGRKLGAKFRELRDPLKEFTVLGGMMVNITDVRHLLRATRSFTAWRHSMKLVLRRRPPRRPSSRHAAAAGQRAGGPVVPRPDPARHPYWLNTAARTLHRDANGRVLGLAVTRESKTLNIRARRAWSWPPAVFRGTRSGASRPIPSPPACGPCRRATTPATASAWPSTPARRWAAATPARRSGRPCRCWNAPASRRCTIRTWCGTAPSPA